MTLVLVGVIIGVALMPIAKAWVRSTGHRPTALRSSESVNVFNGTVFPAPHDARWRRVEANDGSGAEVFIFGDSDIRLSSQTLRVNDMVLAGSGQATVAYYSDVQRCYYAFKQTLALQSVEMAILHAGFGKDEAKTSGDKAMETLAVDAIPPPRPGYRIGAMFLPLPDDPKWLQNGDDEFRYAHCCTSHCMCILTDRIRSLKESGGGTYVEHLKQGDAALKVQDARLARQLSVALELLIGSDAAALEYEDRARWARQFDALMAALGLPDRRG